MAKITNMFLSGSIVEGQSFANHFRHDNKLQDIDVMMEMIHLHANSQIVSIPNAPGFVRVKWSSDDETVLLPHDDEFVDGFKIKQNDVDRCKSTGQPDSLVSFNYNIKPDLASIEASVRSNLANNPRLFYNAIKYAQTLEKSENKMNHFIEFCEYQVKCGVDIIGPKLKELHMPLLSDKQFYHDCFTIMSPAFGFRIPNDYRTMLEAILTFYFNYRHYLTGMVDVLTELDDPSEIFPWFPEVDCVPSFKLDFWPDDMQWFLNRLEKNRPNLFEKIYPLHMHIIPKWSGRTTEVSKNFEFRYSFSLIEIKMAEERSLIEQILNRVARGIFYKYLHKSVMKSSSFNEKYLPSYFVKTTVLWMCETIDFDKIFTPTTTYDQQTEKKLADQLSKRWMTFACSKLKARSCPHYFIEDLNILNGFSFEYLDKLSSILENDVDLDDDQLFYTSENFTGFKEPTEEQSLRLLENFEKLSEQPDFFSDCIKLYNLFVNDSSCSTTLLNGDDDEDEFYVLLQSILLLSNMALFDNSQMNNWELWKKVFLTDVSEQSPVLYPDDKIRKRTPFYIAMTMTSAINAERTDTFISNKEFSTVIQDYSIPLPSFDNFLHIGALLNFPMIMQQQTDQTYRRMVAQDPTNMVSQSIENFLRDASLFWAELLYPDGAELNDQTIMTKREIKDETTSVMEDKSMTNRDEFDTCIHESIPSTRIQPKNTPMNTSKQMTSTAVEHFLSYADKLRSKLRSNINKRHLSQSMK